MTERQEKPTEQDIMTAAIGMDWIQVVLNGGPPCFFFESDERRFCGRAKRWDGHTDKDEYPEHRYVSLDALLATARAEGERNAVESACLKTCPYVKEHE